MLVVVQLLNDRHRSALLLRCVFLPKYCSEGLSVGALSGVTEECSWQSAMA